jgi:hypothetical protein
VMINDWVSLWKAVGGLYRGAQREPSLQCISHSHPLITSTSTQKMSFQTDVVINSRYTARRIRESCRRCLRIPCSVFHINGIPWPTARLWSISIAEDLLTSVAS